MTSKQIPIQNLYYLLCYAWNRLDQGSLVDVSRIESTELVDLFAIVLVKGLDHLSRRGLKRGYSLQEDEIRGIRGRVDILSTARRLLLKHGRVACVFDELNVDIPENRIIKATLRMLANDDTIDKGNRLALLGHYRALRDVTDKPISLQNFRRIQLGGTDGFYKFLLNVCELVHASWLPEEADGCSRFRNFIRDEKRMALLFQYFIFNFLRIECPHLQVFRENISWSAEAVRDSDLGLLPVMQTDISVLCGNRKTIIDTKYYKDTLNEYYDSRKVYSDHLYQLVSYLENARAKGQDVEGVLLYPQIDQPLSLSYVILGFPVRIKTINLFQPWPEIHRDVKLLLN